MFKKLLMLVAVGVVASGASAQVNQNAVWKISGTAGAGSQTYTWFPASGDTVRGMAQNPATGNLLVMSRAAGNVVRRVDSNTGTEINPGFTGAFSGGGGNVSNKISAIDDAIYVCNLDTAGGFKLYRSPNETTSFTLVFDQLVADPTNTTREGDDLAVVRENATDLFAYVPSNLATNFRLYRSYDNGLSWSGTTHTITGASLTSSQCVVPDPSDSRYFFIRSSAANATYRVDNQTSAVVATYSDGAGARQPFGVRQSASVPSEFLICLGIGNSSAGSNPSASIRNTSAITTVLNNLNNLSQGALTGGTNVVNNNGAGDVIYNGSDVYILYTNNAITKFSSVPVPVTMSSFSME